MQLFLECHHTWTTTPRSAINCLCVLNNLIYAGTTSGSILVWDLFDKSDKPKAIFTGIHKDSVTDIKCLEKDYVYSSSKDGTIVKWSEQGPIDSFKNNSNDKFYPMCLALLSIDDQILLFSGSTDRSITQWDSKESESHCLNMTGHQGWVTCLTTTQDAHILISGASDRTICVWDARTLKCLSTLIGHENWVSCLASFNDLLFSGSNDGVVHVWEYKSDKLIQTLTAHEQKSAVKSLCVASLEDKPILFSMGEDKFILQWNIEDWTFVKIDRSHFGSIRSCVLTDSSFLSASRDGSVKHWCFQSQNKQLNHSNTLLTDSIPELESFEKISNSEEKWNQAKIMLEKHDKLKKEHQSQLLEAKTEIARLKIDYSRQKMMADSFKETQKELTRMKLSFESVKSQNASLTLNINQMTHHALKLADERFISTHLLLEQITSLLDTTISPLEFESSKSFVYKNSVYFFKNRRRNRKYT